MPECEGQLTLWDTYEIVRLCADENDPRHRQVIKTGLSLEEAQAHCRRANTHGEGWFDGYEKERT